jgi:hypothetical protein
VLAQANAIVNQVYFLSVNAAGPVGAGRSVYVDPDGQLIAERRDAAPAVTIVEIDPDKVREVREHGTVGLNRLGNQIWPGEAPIRLPAYDGTMTPDRRAAGPAVGPGVPASDDTPTGGGWGHGTQEDVG